MLQSDFVSGTVFGLDSGKAGREKNEKPRSEI
jgi:hypothetical protein